jgi:hypothetical protein
MAEVLKFPYRIGLILTIDMLSRQLGQAVMTPLEFPYRIDLILTKVRSKRVLREKLFSILNRSDFSKL